MKPILFFSQENPKGRILILASEIYPYITIGGLGKFVNGISQGLKENRWETAIFVPEGQTPVYLPSGSYQNQVRSEKLVKKIFFWCRKKTWIPDWLWVQDWEGVYQIREWRRLVANTDSFSGTKIIWTIHSPVSLKKNSGYGYDDSNNDKPIDWGDDFFDFSSLVAEGIKNADLTTTVSPTFAKNLSRLPFFEGAERVLGISNGIDKDDWNPARDNFLDLKLTDSWEQFRRGNKKSLQRIFNLPRREVPLFAFVSRLVPQKGLDLLLRVLPGFLSTRRVQLIVVGCGAKKYHLLFEALKNNFSEQVGLCLKDNFTLPHQVFAGADFLLLPSIAEPYGIVVAEARSYGAVPIVKKIDGLSDQVQNEVNGLSFAGNDADSFLEKLHQALKIWPTGYWWQLSRMGKNWTDSWKTVVKKYEPYLLEED